MRYPPVLALFLAVFALDPAPTDAQQEEAYARRSAVEGMVAAYAQAAPDERSPLVAGLLQAVFPPVPIGFAYAGDFKRGLLPTGLMYAGATVVLLEGVDTIDWTDEEAGSGTLMAVGLAAVVVGYGWGIWGAVDAANDHNARARPAAPALVVAPFSGGMRVGVTVPVG